METIFRIELNLAGIFISAIIIFLFNAQIKTRSIENKNFISLAYIILIELCLDTVFWLEDGKHFLFDREINIIINALYYLFQILQCFMWTRYCILRAKCKKSNIRNFVINSIFAVGTILVIVSIPTGCVFSVNSDNTYLRSWGIWGTVETACCLFYPLFSILLITYRMIVGDKRQKQNGGYLMLVTIIPLISTIIQMKFYGLNFIWVGNAMALLLVLVQIEVKEYQSIQKELANQKIQIMLSQIQPHFLYNSLTTIVYLCDENPQKAKEATVAFSKYLRTNIDSLKQTKLVSFERELEHIKVYLSLEKMRFEEKLNIIFNIESSDFLVPVLTIQPLVENAVKYGVGRKEVGGTITISSKEEENDYVITIEDDGVGFHPYEKQYDGRNHIGIDNVKNRLEGMSGGTLEIVSCIGKGTSVFVRIPKEKK